MVASRSDSVLVIVDLQPSFLKAIPDAEAVIARTEFILRVASLLGVPVVGTEQYPSRMGGTDERILGLMPKGSPVYEKMAFSCFGCDGFREFLGKTGRSQAVLVGIETHICVCSTALHLLEHGVDVMLLADAIACRKDDAHAIGLRRMESAGAVVSHTESAAYEWCESASAPEFKQLLELVKASG